MALVPKKAMIESFFSSGVRKGYKTCEKERKRRNKRQGQRVDGGKRVEQQWRHLYFEGEGVPLWTWFFSPLFDSFMFSLVDSLMT